MLQHLCLHGVPYCLGEVQMRVALKLNRIPAAAVVLVKQPIEATCLVAPNLAIMGPIVVLSSALCQVFAPSCAACMGTAWHAGLCELHIMKRPACACLFAMLS